MSFFVFVENVPGLFFLGASIFRGKDNRGLFLMAPGLFAFVLKVLWVCEAVDRVAVCWFRIS